MARGCGGLYSGGDVNRNAGKIAVGALLNFSGVDSGPCFQSETVHAVGNGERAVDRPARPIERQKGTDARGLHDGPAEPLGLAGDELVVGVEQLSPPPAPISAARWVEATRSVNSTVAK